MLKLFVLSALLAVSTAYTINDFGGQWRAVKIFAKDPVVRECEPLSITATKDFCTCGHNEQVAKVKLQVGTYHIAWPAYFVNTFPAVTESFKTECTCGDYKAGHYVFYRLSDNYFILVFTDPGLEFAALIAKTVPSETEVTEFVKTIDYFKDKTSFFVCTTETLNSNESKVGTGKKWWYHTKSVPHY